jgi:colanic acid/amylovoran biosynthesis protein
MSTESRHVLIVNQHGDNRGDEAAMLAMLDALADRLAPVRFTVLHQFNDPENSAKAGGHEVQFLPLAPRDVRLVRLALATVLRVMHLPWQWAGGAHARAVFGAYDSADLVVSAPGGPYFGDLYAWHEPLHWWYVLLARVFKRPAFLYAPSGGPFRRRWLSPARRFVYRTFDGIVLREQRSAEHLRALFGRRGIPFDVTIDTALGATVTPLPRADWPGVAPPGDTRLIVVSAIDYAYPDAPDREMARARHDDALLAALERAADKLAPAHVVLMPQVHGRHRDAPYLERLAARLRPDVSREVLNEDVESRVQQRIFAAADLIVAGRYHPAVFSVLAAVPAICVAYEHKSLGLMEAAGLRDMAVPIDEVTTERLNPLVDRAVEDAPRIRDQLEHARVGLREQALRTADLASALVR